MVVIMHGQSKTRLYHIWKGIKVRCYNPNGTRYEYYGGKGITMCDEWKEDYPAFMQWANTNGYADNLSIDRIDNNKEYSPDNCRWATDTEQARNHSNNHWITFNGETRILADWCELYNLNPTQYRHRKNAGWLDARIFDTPNGMGRKTMHTINGVEKCLSAWCQEYQIPIATVHKRLKRGMSIEEALTRRPHERKST